MYITLSDNFRTGSAQESGGSDMLVILIKSTVC